MKIKTLLENKTIDEKLKPKHGLSLYIEYQGKKILYDIGPNNYYLQNAEKMGVDIKDIDILIISHGHYDHGKKLKDFLEYNSKAKVYLSKYAFEKHIGMVMKILKFDIGIKKPKNSNRLIFIDKPLEVFPGAFITPDVEYEETVFSDQRLYARKLNKVVKDHFDHEIYLVLSDADNVVLVTGCSHKGIENIIKTIEKSINKELTHVIGGFHLSHYDKTDEVHQNEMDLLGKNLNKKDTEYYACHCTGDDAFTDLSKNMKKLHSLHTGQTIEI